MPCGKGSKERLTKSKERVKAHGEVFTPAWLVRDMCDMLQRQNPDEDAFAIGKTFLEPSCGTGNFLTEIFRRKLERCRDVSDGLTALGSIYGIDIMPDNIQESRKRLYELFTERFGQSVAAQAILNTHIICGNFLTKKDGGGEQIPFLND